MTYSNYCDYIFDNENSHKTVSGDRLYKYHVDV